MVTSLEAVREVSVVALCFIYARHSSLAKAKMTQTPIVTHLLHSTYAIHPVIVTFGIVVMIFGGVYINVRDPNCVISLPATV